MTHARRASASPRTSVPVVAVEPHASAELERLRNALACTQAGLWDWLTASQQLQVARAHAH